MKKKYGLFRVDTVQYTTSNVVSLYKTLGFSPAFLSFFILTLVNLTSCHTNNTPTVAYNVGDTVKYVTQGGVEMIFLVNNNNTLQVGDGHDVCIDEKTKGIVTIPSEINGYPVTKISRSAFSQCTSISEVVLPPTITEIEDGFSTSSIERITIPESVRMIESQALNCPSLREIKVSHRNTVYDSRENCNAIIETKTNVLRCGCVGTTIPKSVTAIGNDAFFGVGLKEFVIPDGIKYIGARAFRSNLAMKKCVIPNTVDTIEMYAFFGSHIDELYIPASVKFIGKGAFVGFHKSVIVDPNNKTYDSRDNCNAIIETSSDKLILGLYTTTIPNGIKSIGEYAFLGQWSYKKIHKGNTIILPSSIQAIENDAFADCDSLTTIISKIKYPFEIGNKAFNFNEHQHLYVPEASLSYYKKTPCWNSFSIHTYK